MTAKPSPYALFRNRNYLFYLLARFLASFGAQMLTVAIGWDLYERTGSAMALAFVGLSQFLPMVLMTLPAGHVADNHDRRKIMLVMQMVMTLAAFGLVLISYKKADVAWVYGCLLLMGTARTFLWSASASFLPKLVSREEFPQAVNWSSSSFQFSAVAGPAAGGALIGLTHSAMPVYLIDTAAGVITCILISLVRTPHASIERQEMTLQSLLGGFKFVFNTPLILAAITLDLFAVLFGGATALLPIYAKDILKVGPEGLGFLQAALPIGSLVCALFLAHRPPMRKAGRSLLWAVLAFGLATIGFGYSKSFPLSMALLFVCGFADNISVIVRHTLVQMLTPDEMRGRVSAVNNLFIGTSNELGGFESGATSHFFGPVASVVFGGIATIVTLAIVMWKWPQLRRHGRLVQETK